MSLEIPKLPNEVLVSIIRMENKRWVAEQKQKHKKAMKQTLTIINSASYFHERNDPGYEIDPYMEMNGIEDFDWDTAKFGPVQMFYWWSWYIDCTCYYDGHNVVTMTSWFDDGDLFPGNGVCSSNWHWTKERARRPGDWTNNY